MLLALVSVPRPLPVCRGILGRDKYEVCAEFVGPGEALEVDNLGQEDDRRQGIDFRKQRSHPAGSRKGAVAAMASIHGDLPPPQRALRATLLALVGEGYANVLRWGCTSSRSSGTSAFRSSRSARAARLALGRGLDTPLDQDDSGRTRGTVNSGVIWAGKHIHLGLKAALPFNARTGKNVGARTMLHFVLEELFLRTFGRPFFGR